jgi:hypothetical protein
VRRSEVVHKDEMTLLREMTFTILALLFACLATCPCSDPQLCNMLQIPPRKEFFVFGAGDSKDYVNFDWSHLTTICPMWQVPTPPPSLDLVCYAHKKGILNLRLHCTNF